MFVVLEGIDGCGKSTQATLLMAALERAGRRPLHLREPGGTWLGEELRRLLLDPGARISELAELCVYEAARAQLVLERVVPERAVRDIVLERYYYSTVAYQGHGLGLDPVWIEDLSRRITRGVEPDRVLLFDLDPVVARSRITRAVDRIEQRDPAFFVRVREGYLAQARARPDQFVVVPGDLDPQAAHHRVREALGHGV